MVFVDDSVAGCCSNYLPFVGCRRRHGSSRTQGELIRHKFLKSQIKWWKCIWTTHCSMATRWSCHRERRSADASLRKPAFCSVDANAMLDLSYSNILFWQTFVFCFLVGKNIAKAKSWFRLSRNEKVSADNHYKGFHFPFLFSFPPFEFFLRVPPDIWH